MIPFFIIHNYLRAMSSHPRSISVKAMLTGHSIKVIVFCLFIALAKIIVKAFDEHLHRSFQSAYVTRRSSLFELAVTISGTEICLAEVIDRHYAVMGRRELERKISTIDQWKERSCSIEGL